MGWNDQDKTESRPAANKTAKNSDTSIKNTKITFIAKTGKKKHLGESHKD